jgi:hypothetical protein
VKKLSKKLSRTLTISGVAAAFALSSAGIANATAFRWQGYQRDSSWNCGGPGSTHLVNGLYVLPCTKHIGASWQVVLIITGGGAETAIIDKQYNEWDGGGQNVGERCDGGTNLGSTYIDGLDLLDIVGPGETYACFSRTQTNPNTWVWGYFDITVAKPDGSVGEATYVSPATLTGS